MRIGLVVAGALAPDAHSGTPWALAEAFAGAGHEVVAVEVDLGTRAVQGATAAIGTRLMLERRGALGARPAMRLATVSAEFCAIASRRLSRRLSDQRWTGDVLVQYGTVFLPPAGVPMVTYEDMTSVQAARYPQWPVAQLSQRDLARRVRHQQRVYGRAIRCCTTTEWPASSIVEDFGVDPAKVKVVGIGRNHRPATRLSRDWSRARYLFVGRDWDRKNGPGLLEAFARVRQRLPHAQLGLVGPASAPEPPGVTLHGPLSFGSEGDRRKLECLYDDATCFALPSLCEPSAISYAEAMGAGLPVIATSEGGSRHVVGGGGIVIDPSDIDGLAEAMIRLTDPATAGPMARAGLELAAGYEWTSVASRTVADL